MDLFLDVQWRGLDHQVGPVLFVLAAPDQLGVQVAVAALVGNPDRALLILAHHRLVFGRGDILARRLVMGEGFNGFGTLFVFARHNSIQC